jgi:hypothetical protein
MFPQASAPAVWRKSWGDIMSDFKTLLVIVVSMGALAAMWWFGWFGPIAEQFLEIKRLTTYD